MLTPDAVHHGLTDELQATRQNVLDDAYRRHPAREVGEVRNGTILLETLVVPAAFYAGLTPEMVMINDQKFTKTANCWGVDNLKKGTNTNRIVLLEKR